MVPFHTEKIAYPAAPGSRRDSSSVLDLARILLLFGGILGLFFAVLGPAAQASGWKNFHVEDSRYYTQFSDLVAHYGLLQDPPEVDEFVRARMPVYPLLLLVVAKAGSWFGVPAEAAYTVANIGFFAAAVVLMYLTLRRATGDRRIAFAAAASMLITPGMAPYVFAQMPEAFTLFLWALVTVCLTSPNRTTAPFVAGLLAGAANLTKPITLAVVVPLILMLPFLVRERRLSRPILFALGLVPLPAVWIARNWFVWGALVMTPNSGGHLYDFVRPMLRQAQGFSLEERHPLTGAPTDPRIPTTAEKWKEKFGFNYENLGKRYVVLGRLATEEIVANPMAYVKLTAQKHPRLYFGAGTQALYSMSFADADQAKAATDRPGWLWRSGWWAYQAVAGFVLGLLYLLAAIGVWKGLGDPRLRPLVVVCATLLVVQAAAIGPFGHTRYRFLMTPFFAALAAVGFVKLRSGQDKVVPVDDLLPAGAGQQFGELRRGPADDAAGLVGGVVGQPTPEFDPGRVLDRHHVP